MLPYPLEMANQIFEFVVADSVPVVEMMLNESVVAERARQPDLFCDLEEEKLGRRGTLSI
jgi:hypothetical protein